MWCREQIKENFDIVFMAHGVQKPRTLYTMEEDDWFEILQGNLSSSIGLTQVLVKENKVNDGGLFVYCSSIQATAPRMGRGLYGACKAGLEGFSKSVAVELAPKGIRSVALRLGQLTKTMNNVKFSKDEESKLKTRSLLEWVNPNDVAALVYNLYWQKSLTGTTIELDSGHGRNIW